MAKPAVKAKLSKLASPSVSSGLSSYSGSSSASGSRSRSLCKWTALAPTSKLHMTRASAFHSGSSAINIARSLNYFGFYGKRFGRGIQSIPESPRKFKQVVSTMKVYVISDVHTDHEANMDWLRNLSSNLYKKDTLICAGDVTDNLQIFKTSMTILKEKFKDVFFVPGNHDLWCRRKEDHVEDSLAKLEVLTDFCNSLGVLTTPAKLDGVWIVPLLSWYHESWDKERDMEGYNIPPVDQLCTDFSACKWPAPLDNNTDSIARHFDELNVLNLQSIPDLQQPDCQVITFSHFLPRFELCPEKRMLLYPNLPKMIGSDWLEARVRSIHGPNGSPTACHVFGHTHFFWDATLDGVRYIQAPLAYPRERAQRQDGAEKYLPLCVYDSDNGALIGGPLRFRWSDYYRSNDRDPDNQELAPWAKAHYRKVNYFRSELDQPCPS